MNESQFEKVLKGYLDNHREWSDETFVLFYKNITYYAKCQLEKLYKDEEPNEAMDGDFDSAMASAGLGMDEDYGDYGEDSRI